MTTVFTTHFSIVTPAGDYEGSSGKRGFVFGMGKQARTRRDVAALIGSVLQIEARLGLPVDGAENIDLNRLSKYLAAHTEGPELGSFAGVGMGRLSTTGMAIEGLSNGAYSLPQGSAVRKLAFQGAIRLIGSARTGNVPLNSVDHTALAVAVEHLRSHELAVAVLGDVSRVAPTATAN